MLTQRSLGSFKKLCEPNRPSLTFVRELSFEALVMPLGGDELLPGFSVLSPDCGVAARAEQPVDSAVGRVLANITSHQVPGIATL